MPEYSEQVWVYGGLRWNGEKLVHMWVGPDGEGRRFPASRGERWVIGRPYNVEATADHSSVRLGHATWTGAELHPDAPTWVAADRAAQATKQRAAAERSALTDEVTSMDTMTMAQAREFLHGGSWTTRTARVAVILKVLGL